MNHEIFDRCQFCLARHTCAFRDLPEEVRREFQVITCTKRYARRTEVVREGDDAHGLFIVKSGVLRLLRVSLSGKVAIVKLMGPSGILGLTELLTGESYALSAETVEDSQLEYVDRERFLSFLHDYPRVAVELLTWLGREFRQTVWKLCGTTSTLTGRLWRNLQDLSTSCGHSTGEGIELSPYLTVPDLAHGLGCSRQWSSKLLGELEDEGWIKRRGRQIVLPSSVLSRSLPEKL